MKFFATSKSFLREVRGFPEAQILLVLLSLFLSSGVALAQTDLAPVNSSNNQDDSVLQQAGTLPPPLITTYNKQISNNELFYIGGTATAARAKIIIYIQNTQEKSILSKAVEVDDRGNWFYSHPEFLSPGQYVIWAQLKRDDSISPPSPQIDMEITATAFQFGGLRASYEIIYAILAAVSFLITLLLIGFAYYHFRQHRTKGRRLNKELNELGISVKRGFALLKKDIEAELASMNKLKTSDGEAGLPADKAGHVKAREKKLKEDLEKVERYIGKELYDVEKMIIR